MSTGGEEAWRAGDKAFIHDGDLEEILGQSTGLQVVVISLADASEEAHRPGPAELKLKHGEHEALCLENLLCAVSSVDHVHDFVNRWAVDLFVLGSNEQRSSANQLKLAQRDDLIGEEAIDVVLSQEQCLREKVEPLMNLDEPVHEDGAHGPLDLGLLIHVVAIRKKLDLRAR